MKVHEIMKIKRKELDLSADKIAEALGVSRATIYRYECGDIEKLPTDILIPLAKILKTTPAELMGIEKRDNIITDKDIKKIGAIPVEEFGVAPVIGKVCAGNGILAEDNIIGYEIVDKKYANANHFFLTVKGNSMDPKLDEGDLVLVRFQPSVDSGTVGVFLIDDMEAVIKKVYYGSDFIRLSSFNDNYSPLEFKGYDVMRIRVVGKVIESKRKW